MKADMVVNTIDDQALADWDWRMGPPPPVGSQIMRRPDGTHYLREPEGDDV